MQTPHDSRCRAGLCARINHQHHRPTGQLGQMRGRAIRRIAVGDESAIEQTHHPFTNDEVRLFSGSLQASRQGFGTHRPGIEIETGAPGGGGMKSGVYVIGAGFGRSDRDAGT